MQSQQIPVDRKVINTDFLSKDNFSTLSVNSPKKTQYIKLLGLLASISSVGIALSPNQSVQAKTLELGKKQQHFAAKPFLLNNLASESEFETILNQEQPIETILGLPADKIATVPEKKAQKKVEKKIYTVKSGDTIVSIARQYGVSSSQIIAANQLSNPNLIKVNYQLVIPSTESAQENSYQTEANDKVIISNAAPESLSSIVQKKAESRSKKVTIEIPVDNSSNEESVVEKANNTEKIAVDNIKDPYISRLRQDIVELRTRYQQQSGDSELIEENVSEDITATTSVIPTAKTTVIDTEQNLPIVEEVENTDSKIEQAIAPNSIAVESFNSLVSFSKIDSSIPNLPPLSSPEEYLPDNPIFNGYIWPAKGTLTSGYGWRWGRMHKGIDIAAPVGTPIMAAASGEVIFSGWNSGGYGNLVKLKHHDGSITFYAHNHRVLVKKGQTVKQGQLIAEMGSTGRSTGPHLHFEIRPNGSTAINPIARLPKK